MTLVRWNPLRDLSGMQSEMNRLFDEFFTHGSESVDRAAAWSPMVDISETDDAIVMHAELPGLQKNDVKINLQENVLTLEGEKKSADEEKDKCYYRLERSYGKFQRSFVLPASVQSDGVKAKFKDGVLTIVLPKAESAKPKQIDVAVD